MTLERLIYNRLTGNTALKSGLAKYAGKPAIFPQKAPDDRADGWAVDKPQYPHAEYLVDYVADPERHSSGTVTVNIYSSEEAKPPEELVPAVRDALTDIILQTDERAYAITWERTELFDMSNSQSPDTLVNGAMVEFLLIAFPAQETRAPDPAKGMQEFLHDFMPGCLVIGRDHIDQVYEPSDEHPAFYVRVAGYQNNRETYSLRWIDCRIALHVIAPTPEGRATWVRSLADALDWEGEVTLLDDSPMLIQGIEVDSSAEFLTRGQLMVQAQYSMPKKWYAHPLRHAHFTGKEEQANG